MKISEFHTEFTEATEIEKILSSVNSVISV